VRILLFLSFFAFPIILFSQEKRKEQKDQMDFNSKYNSSDSIKKPEEKKATIDMYREITFERDTTYIDTSLTIKRFYRFNYLRRDSFGLLAFPNEGQTYNTLQYSLNDFSAFPEFGFKAKQFNYIEASKINYYSVATPITELYYKTVMGSGQSVDSFFSLNISPELNCSVAYRGLSSEGKYSNSATSTGNFRFTTSYTAKNKRYSANAHFFSNDVTNEENGGITTTSDFESGDSSYTTRLQLEVYLTDAFSYIKGKRLFLDHSFRINPKEGSNNLYVTHQFNYENQYFEYNQETVTSTVGDETIYRFGDSYKTSDINDQTHYNKSYNKAGLIYENKLLGRFQFFAEDFFENYYYNQVLILDSGTIQSSISRRIDNIGGQYNYQKNKWTGNFIYSRSMTNQNLSNLDAKMQYHYNDKIQFKFQYQNINKLPNDSYNLYQSSWVNYNWDNDFKNEKINSFSASATTPWLTASVQYTVLNDHLYFEDVSSDDQTASLEQIIAPAQYDNTINYLSAKVNKEFKFWKLGLDNTILYQKTTQQDLILNVPELVTRNTLYYSDNMFEKALFFQTGFSFNYFTKYYANEYNPVIGDFFVQNETKIGNYANIDFFFNAQIKQARIYFIVEHVNASITGYNYYSSPSNPYRDLTLRFGIVWNFFK
jgi:hypothetical protein